MSTASSAGSARRGFIMAGAYLLAENPNPTEDEIRKGLEGNLCRCTGYVNIVKSVQAAAVAMGGSRDSAPSGNLSAAPAGGE